MGAEPIDRVGLEADVRVDPHDFLEPFGERIRRHLATPLIDGGVARHTTHHVSASLEDREPALALRLDVTTDRNQYDA